MKRFLTAIVFCVCLLIAGLYVFMPVSKAEEDILTQLLKLPAPPPPNPNFPENAKQRSEEFYDQKNVPKDDAPIDDLMAYWARQSQTDRTRNYAPKPSPETVRRIRREIEKNPEKLVEYLNLFAGDEDGIEFVKRFYDAELINKQFERDWRETVKNWLTWNSPYFSDELMKSAQQIADTEEYVAYHDELLALARVDWEKAQPILDRLLENSSQPISQTVARWAYYQHALDTGDTSTAEKYRKLLMATVENKNEKPGNRDMAMDALVRGGDFEGRDEWYLTLLEDETLHELRVNGQTFTGLTTIISQSPSDKFTERFIELLKSDSKAVRSAAIRNLAFNGKLRQPEVLRMLLPWLLNKDWANDVNGSRQDLISAFSEIKMPESVPGLIALLTERGKARRFVPDETVNANSNSNTSYREVLVDAYVYRNAAVLALGFQRDLRAVPALQAILNETEGWEKQTIIRAILKCGGYGGYEQAEAVEAAARSNLQRQKEIQLSANLAANSVNRVDDDDEDSDSTTVSNYAVNTLPNTGMYYGIQTDPKLMLGTIIIEDREPDAALVSMLADRIERLETSEPELARQLRDIVRNWGGAAVNVFLLRNLRNGRANIADLLTLLSRRKELREQQINDVYSIRGNNAAADGIAACLLGEPGEYDGILAGGNNLTKTAMLGCARLIRVSLPVQKVAENLGSQDKMLVLAAEKYLESEDSPEARNYVLSMHPNEAKILGARTKFEGDYAAENETALSLLFNSIAEDAYYGDYYFWNDFDELIKVEKKLQKEVLENPQILGIYAYNNNFIRIYNDKAVFGWEDNPARYRERVLEKNEFDRLKNYLAAQKVDELPPFLSYCGEDCADGGKELLMLGRNGGRRVFRFGYEIPRFFAELDKIFEDFRRPPAKLRYYLQDKIPGLSVLLDSDDQKTEAVWKNGADFRVLINNTVRREQIDKELERLEEADADNNVPDVYERSLKRRETRAFESFGWFRFDGAKLLNPALQPDRFSLIPNRDQLAVQPTQEQWKARTAAIEIRTDSEGIYKVVRGNLTKLRDGYYGNPIITPDGRWVLAGKYGMDDDDSYFRVVRINLLNGKEFKVPFKQYPPLMPIVFIPQINKFLLGTAYPYYDYEDTDEDSGTRQYQNYYLLDAQTGALQKIKDTAAPLAAQTFRPLQTVAGKPDELWVAVPDGKANQTRVGRFNARTFVFSEVLTLPLIEFGSMTMWVDEPEGKIYLAYQGHLISIPLKKP